LVCLLFSPSKNLLYLFFYSSFHRLTRGTMIVFHR
jgi:hypothetical protein